MFAQIGKWISPPVFEDDEGKTRNAALLNAILWTVLAAATVSMAVVALLLLSGWVVNLVFGTVIAVACVGALLVLRRRYVGLAGLILVIALWLSITLILYLNHTGIRGTVSAVYFVVVIIAGLLLEERIVIGLGVLTLLAVGGVFYAETSGLVAVSLPAKVTWIDLITLAFCLGAAGALLRTAVNRMSAALQRTHRGERELAESNRQLQEIRASLEERVAVRTRNLEAAAEVSRVVASLMDLEDLARQVVDLARDSFDLYYVGLFLVDQTGELTGEANRWAVLRAGTGEPGRVMVERQHRFAVGDPSSMIGRCVGTGEAVIALDVGREARRFDNPLLPRTRSEMALPLFVRGQVIGALTIQSDRAAAFSQDDVTTMRTMADQVAVTIDNARNFARTQEALRRTEEMQRRYQAQAWAEYLRARLVSGYRQVGAQVTSLEKEILPEVQQAVSGGRTLVEETRFSGKTLVSESDNPPASLTVPLVQGDRVIGALGFKGREGQRGWSAAQVALVEALAEQLVLAADNQRLIDETQRRAAREQLTRRVIEQVRSADDMEEILRVAVQELGRQLGASEAVVRLGTESRLAGDVTR